MRREHLGILVVILLIAAAWKIFATTEVSYPSRDERLPGLQVRDSGESDNEVASSQRLDFDQPVAPSTGQRIPSMAESPLPSWVLRNARVAVAHIREGTTAQWEGKWGDPHHNRERNLPEESADGTPITYQEYYLPKSPDDESRWGTNRLVVGSDERVYITTTHYGEVGEPPFVYLGSLQ